VTKSFKENYGLSNMSVTLGLEIMGGLPNITPCIVICILNFVMKQS